MRSDPMLLRLRRNRINDADATTLPERVISLQIRGMVERLSFEEGTEVVLGRYDVTASPTPRFDLSRFGARERGVSREHALLHFENDTLTLTDLKSVNGTSVNRVRIEPNEPRLIHNGDEITLGTLGIVVRFELSVDTKIITVPSAQHGDDTAPMVRKPNSVPETGELVTGPLDEQKPSPEVS
jgi:pSer/pThr/pTyr-binding forkhead associated (FHA) protein